MSLKDNPAVSGKRVEGSTKIQQTLPSECKWASSRVQCAAQTSASGKVCCCLVAVLPQRYRQELWSLPPAGGGKLLILCHVCPVRINPCEAQLKSVATHSGVSLWS